MGWVPGTRMTTFNLHFQEPLNLTVMLLVYSWLQHLLSISIFRSLWILPTMSLRSTRCPQWPFNLHFQEPLNLTTGGGAGGGAGPFGFQSPFSGAFESYPLSDPLSWHIQRWLSISIFRSLWILLKKLFKCCSKYFVLSISIFRSLWILHWYIRCSVVV